jgi:putative phosphoesterase
MKVAVLSDTHAPRYWKACPPAVARRLEGVDLILHAGDVCRAWVLEELAAFAPVRAVLGNNDHPDVSAWGASVTLELDLAFAARGTSPRIDSTGRSTSVSRLCVGPSRQLSCPSIRVGSVV